MSSSAPVLLSAVMRRTCFKNARDRFQEWTRTARDAGEGSMSPREMVQCAFKAVHRATREVLIQYNVMDVITSLVTERKARKALEAAQAEAALLEALNAKRVALMDATNTSVQEFEDVAEATNEEAQQVWETKVTSLRCIVDKIDAQLKASKLEQTHDEILRNVNALIEDIKVIAGRIKMQSVHSEGNSGTLYTELARATALVKMVSNAMNSCDSKEEHTRDKAAVTWNDTAEFEQLEQLVQRLNEVMNGLPMSGEFGAVMKLEAVKRKKPKLKQVAKKIKHSLLIGARRRSDSSKPRRASDGTNDRHSVANFPRNARGSALPSINLGRILPLEAPLATMFDDPSKNCTPAATSIETMTPGFSHDEFEHSSSEDDISPTEQRLPEGSPSAAHAPLNLQPREKRLVPPAPVQRRGSTSEKAVQLERPEICSGTVDSETREFEVDDGQERLCSVGDSRREGGGDNDFQAKMRWAKVRIVLKFLNLFRMLAFNVGTNSGSGIGGAEGEEADSGGLSVCTADIISARDSGSVTSDSKLVSNISPLVHSPLTNLPEMSILRIAEHQSPRSIARDLVMDTETNVLTVPRTGLPRLRNGRRGYVTVEAVCEARQRFVAGEASVSPDCLNPTTVRPRTTTCDKHTALVQKLVCRLSYQASQTAKAGSWSPCYALEDDCFDENGSSVASQSTSLLRGNRKTRLSTLKTHPKLSKDYHQLTSRGCFAVESATQSQLRFDDRCAVYSAIRPLTGSEAEKDEAAFARSEATQRWVGMHHESRSVKAKDSEPRTRPSSISASKSNAPISSHTDFSADTPAIAVLDHRTVSEQKRTVSGGVSPSHRVVSVAACGDIASDLCANVGGDRSGGGRCRATAASGCGLASSRVPSARCHTVFPPVCV
eukprot:TRINITY_DN57480_c0_g1_i1.p1 TRINITY_DN57480_c0_g1~~TRINITY_DN57480_c0_g1_i1.p1  ORF type:complete len:914 (+),score=119.07 TRINITY_DN57480_c0_g1_i1:77-2743(+)